MPSSLKSKLILSLALVALLALPALAQAKMAFVRGMLKTTVYVANDDGSGVRKIGPGATPHVSPDGALVAYSREGAGHKSELVLAPTGGGAGKRLMTGWREPYSLAFTPNSEQILAIRGPEIGKRKLVLITIATGEQKVIASGFFYGFSFDPEGKQIVYAKANSEKYPPRSDVYKVSAAGIGTVALTHDHVSEYPLWGPTGKIVFVKLLEADRRRYGPKNELYLMDESGKGVKRLTHTKVDQLLQGLFPTAWSGNGKRILAQFGGQDTTYAVGVNAQTGAQRPIQKATEQGLVGSAISFDGKTVFGFEGGYEGGAKRNVVKVPFSGGKATVLVKNAFEPSFGG